MSLLETLSRITTLFEENDIPYMLIGAYALAFLGQVRATLDLDIAIAINSENFNNLVRSLEKNRFTISLENLENPCFIVNDQVSGIEIEIWRKLNGVILDDVLNRRLQVTTPNGLKLWIIGPENYIVNKLARPDRRAVDEEDVVSVLREQANKLDYNYLYDQATQAKVLELLKTIQRISMNL